jgi:hypothetical protein
MPFQPGKSFSYDDEDKEKPLGPPKVDVNVDPFLKASFLKALNLAKKENLIEEKENPANSKPWQSSEPSEISREVRDIAKKIGEFYLIKNDECYNDAADELLKLQITNIQINENIVSITTNRPGMLIGKRASNVDQLEEFIEKKIKIIECKDNLYNYLIPVEEEASLDGE